MKCEQFVDYMTNTVKNWLDAKQFPSLKEKHEGFLSTIESFRDLARQQDTAEQLAHEMLIEYAKGSLQALALVNAGGIFVIMTIVSGLLTSKSPWFRLVPSVSVNAKYYICGLSSAVLSIGASYISQLLFNQYKISYGKFVQVVAILLWVFSLISFIYGSVYLLDAFTSEDVLAIIATR